MNNHEHATKVTDITGNFDERLLEEAVEVAMRMYTNDGSHGRLEVGQSSLLVVTDRSQIYVEMVEITIGDKSYFVGV